MSSKSVLQECQVRSVLQECLTRVSSKSCSIVSSKGVLQECHLSVWTQDVSQMSLLEMWQISIVSVCQHTCLHSGSWASSCFYTTCKVCTEVIVLKNIANIWTIARRYETVTRSIDRGPASTLPSSQEVYVFQCLSYIIWTYSIFYWRYQMFVNCYCIIGLFVYPLPKPKNGDFCPISICRNSRTYRPWEESSVCVCFHIATWDNSKKKIKQTI